MSRRVSWCLRGNRGRKMGRFMVVVEEGGSLVMRVVLGLAGFGGDLGIRIMGVCIVFVWV